MNSKNEKHFYWSLNTPVSQCALGGSYQSPSKTPPPSFLAIPPLNLQTVQVPPPFSRQFPSLYIGFLLIEYSPNIQIFHPYIIPSFKSN